jgi:hypothetical protein
MGKRRLGFIILILIFGSISTSGFSQTVHARLDQVIYPGWFNWQNFVGGIWAGYMDSSNRIWFRNTLSCIVDNPGITPVKIHANAAGSYYYKITQRPSGNWVMWPDGAILRCVNSDNSKTYSLAAGADQLVIINSSTTPSSEIAGTLKIELHETGFLFDNLLDTVLIPMGTDVTPPTVPVFSNIAVSGTSIAFTVQSSDSRSGLFGFKILLNGNQVNSGENSWGLYQSSGSRTITLSNLSPGTSYTIAAIAYDNVENISSQNSFQTVTSPGSFSLSSPANGGSFGSGPTSVTLAWGTSSGATSYDVYFGTNSNPAFYQNTNNTSLSVSVSAGNTYYWKVQAKNSNGTTWSNSGTWSFSVSGNVPTLIVTPVEAFHSEGLPQGPFTPPSKDYTLQNTGSGILNWTITRAWVNSPFPFLISSTSGTLSAEQSVTITISVNTNYPFVAGTNVPDTFYFNNVTNSQGNTSRMADLTVTANPPLYPLPFYEGFSSANFPLNWSKQNIGTGITDNWVVSGTATAGGSANEIECYYQDVNPGTTRLITPRLNTSGLTALNLSFKHFLDSFGSGGVTLKIQTSLDRSTWKDEGWWIQTSSADIGPETVKTTLTHNLNSSTTYVAFVITGNLWMFDAWYIDDIAITAHTPKNDFNQDGNEDILWRYYGPGGYNYVWYMGTSGGATGLQMADSKMINLFQTLALSKVYWDAREVGDLQNRTVDKVYWDAREAGSVRSRKGASLIRQGGFGNLEQRVGIQTYSTPLENTLQTQGVTYLGEAALPSVADTNWTIAGTGDFNGDGKVDILWRYYGAGGYNYVWYMDGVTCTGGAMLPSVTDLNWQIVGTGDFNADRKVDILWRYYGPGGYDYVWYMDGATCTGGASLPSVADSKWQIVGTGDFNGDGKTDILWRYYGPDGYNYVWYLNGVTYAGEAALPSVTDLNWQIVGTGDFNGDGKTDILWRYYGSGGYNYVWYMNGVTYTGGASLTSVTDLNWRIANR